MYISFIQIENNNKKIHAYAIDLTPPLYMDQQQLHVYLLHNQTCIDTAAKRNACFLQCADRKIKHIIGIQGYDCLSKEAAVFIFCQAVCYD